jgi:AcrR family transcriptional regulator
MNIRPTRHISDEPDIAEAARPKPVPRDARMVRTDKALRHAMLVLLERKPFDQITIRDIVAEAGVHYATFFRHHATKEALLDHVAADQIDELVELTQVVGVTVDHHAGFVTLCRYVDDHRVLWTALLTGGAAGAMRDELLCNSRAFAVQRGDKDGWIPVELATSCSVGLIVETISWWLAKPADAYTIEQVAAIMHRLVNGAMLEPEAL